MSIELWVVVGVLFSTLIGVLFLNERDRMKKMNFFLENEIPTLRQLGLEAFIGVDTQKYVVFFHPAFLYKTSASLIGNGVNTAASYYADYKNIVQYNFNPSAAKFLSGSDDSLSDLLTLQNRYFYKRVRAIKKNAKKFMINHSINVELSSIVPFILIFGNHPEAIIKALEAKVHPAVLAEIIVANKLNINELDNLLEEAKAYVDLPISWLADIYDFKYDKR